MSTHSEASYVEFTPEQLQLASGTPVGAGAISQVVRSTLLSPPITIVTKILSKIQLLQQKKVEAAMAEKTALLRMGPHPFVARLYGTAQSEDELYFVMEDLPHGDLLQHIRRTAAKRVQQYNGDTNDATAAPSDAPAPALRPIPVSSRQLRCLDFNDIQLISAQLILGLARAYEKDVVLRDFKPENIVFDKKYRACLIDFDTVDLDGRINRPVTNHGVALQTPPTTPQSAAAPMKRLSVSEIQSMRKKTASFCGTAQYVSPEMVGECRWSFSSDLWALGATVYEMMYGVHMFSGLGPFDVLKRVVGGVAAADNPVPFPVIDLGGAGAADDAAVAATTCEGHERFDRVRGFILALMDTDPFRRLGVHPDTHALDVEALRRHPLFEGFDWSVLDSHVSTFRPRRFAVKGDAAAAAASDGVADPDPSPTLQGLYHELPYDDPAYAEYVYKATADANPFERFMQHILLRETTGDTQAPQQPASSESLSQPAGPSPERCEEEKGDSDSDDIMDVIDDVGMQYSGLAADEDFQH